MKRYVIKSNIIKVNAIIILIIIMSSTLFSCNTELDTSYNVPDKNMSREELVEDISNKIIRFHVIANSDSKEDQRVKIIVKNEILKYISPKLEDSKSIDESRKIIEENNEAIKKIAIKCLNENGYDYSVTSTLGREDFPVKSYGDITLPQGNYEAYRVILGEGKGHNWWCVMFPPLCFIDITKGEAEISKTNEEMKNVLGEEEFNEVNNKKNSDTIQYRFKIKEIFDSLFN